MGIEFELKFRATETQLAEVAKSLTGTVCEYEMQTTYYDTPSGALSGRFYTLRRRLENDCSVCTLKYPADEIGRGEVEVQCQDIHEALPELCRLSGIADMPSILKEGIVAICGASFHRTAVTVTQPDCTVEVALDKGILFGGGKEIPLGEVEVEQKDGSREAVFAYAVRLAHAHGLVLERGSKFRRALALARGE